MKRNNVPLALDRAAPVKATGPRRTMHQYYHSEHCVLCDAPAADGADLRRRVLCPATDGPSSP